MVSSRDVERWSVWRPMEVLLAWTINISRKRIRGVTFKNKICFSILWEIGRQIDFNFSTLSKTNSLFFLLSQYMHDRIRKCWIIPLSKKKNNNFNDTKFAKKKRKYKLSKVHKFVATPPQNMWLFWGMKKKKEIRWPV